MFSRPIDVLYQTVSTLRTHHLFGHPSPIRTPITYSDNHHLFEHHHLFGHPSPIRKTSTYSDTQHLFGHPSPIRSPSTYSDTHHLFGHPSPIRSPSTYSDTHHLFGHPILIRKPSTYGNQLQHSSFMWICFSMGQNIAKRRGTSVPVVRPTPGLVSHGVLGVHPAAPSCSTESDPRVRGVTVVLLVADNTDSCPCTTMVYVEAFFVAMALKRSSLQETLPRIPAQSGSSVPSVCNQTV